MKKIFSNSKKQTTSLYERNLKIHRNLWKFYGLSLFFGIAFILIKGTN
ncbi:MAG: hypothetical protein RBR65_05920 [Aliarcobacter sp.]|jgi:hypothetical protein|nr:hypothetical protein [Aliarcobacter sp.]